MPGVRIKPKEGTHVPDDALIVVRDLSRPIPAPKDGRRPEDVLRVCHRCGVQHPCKTYHFQLRAGSVIVSDTVWARLQSMVNGGGFEFANEVPDPPAQGMFPGQEKEVTMLEKMIRNVTIPATAGVGR